MKKAKIKMFFKSIEINVICFNIPCEIAIFNEKGNLLKKEKLSSFKSKINICTKDKTIKLLAKNKNQIVCKILSLNCCRCQKHFVNFQFNKSFSQTVSSFITLKDFNYGFPVSMSILNLKK